jgi:hypothetical protein
MSSPLYREGAQKPRSTNWAGAGDFDNVLRAIVRPSLPARIGKRLLIVLALMPAAFVLAVGLIREVDSPPPQPLDFSVVAERSRFIGAFVTRTEVEHLLGPPTERHVVSPELKEVELQMENGGRNMMPTERVWDRWTDPKDNGRSVAVLYAGFARSDKVYRWFKTGF